MRSFSRDDVLLVGSFFLGWSYKGSDLSAVLWLPFMWISVPGLSEGGWFGAAFSLHRPASSETCVCMHTCAHSGVTCMCVCVSACMYVCLLCIIMWSLLSKTFWLYPSHPLFSLFLSLLFSPVWPEHSQPPLYSYVLSRSSHDRSVLRFVGARVPQPLQPWWQVPAPSSHWSQQWPVPLSSLHPGRALQWMSAGRSEAPLVIWDAMPHSPPPTLCRSHDDAFWFMMMLSHLILLLLLPLTFGLAI